MNGADLFSRLAWQADGGRLLELRRIFLEGLALDCRIGIHDFERAGSQRVLVDVELFLEPPAAIGHDDIGQVLDYDFVRREAQAFAAGRRIALQETLAEAIAEFCLARPGVAAVRVATRKPDVYPDCAAVGFELLRLRQRDGDC